MTGPNLDWGYTSASAVTEDSNFYTYTKYLTKLTNWGDMPAVEYGFAYCDASCGEFRATTVNYEQLKSELARIKPVEILAAGTKQKLLPFQIVPEETVDLPEEITDEAPVQEEPAQEAQEEAPAKEEPAQEAPAQAQGHGLQYGGNLHRVEFPRAEEGPVPL